MERPAITDTLINDIVFRHSIDLNPQEMYSFVFRYDAIDRLYHYGKVSPCERYWIFKTTHNEKPLYGQLDEYVVDFWCRYTDQEETTTCTRTGCTHHAGENIQYKLFMTHSLEIFIRCIEDGTKLVEEEHEDYDDDDDKFGWMEYKNFLKEHDCEVHFHIPPRPIFLKLIDKELLQLLSDTIIDRPWEVYNISPDVLKILIKMTKIYMFYRGFGYHYANPSSLMRFCDQKKTPRLMPASLTTQYFYDKISPMYRLFLRKKFIQATEDEDQSIINAATLIYSIDMPVDDKLYDDFKFFWTGVTNMYHEGPPSWIFKTTWEDKPLYCQLISDKRRSRCRKMNPLECSTHCFTGTGACPKHNAKTWSYSYKLFMTRYPGLLAGVMYCKNREDRETIIQSLREEREDIPDDRLNAALFSYADEFEENTISMLSTLDRNDIHCIKMSDSLDEPWKIFKEEDKDTLRKLTAMCGIFLRRLCITDTPLYNDLCKNCKKNDENNTFPLIPRDIYRDYYSKNTMSYYRLYLHHVYEENYFS